MSAPISQMGRLSLEAMTPMTRSKTTASAPDAGLSSDQDTNSNISVDEDDSAPPVRSPADLLYRVGHLPEKTQNVVRDTFAEPPKLVLQRCRLVDDTYAFQMTETVTRSVRFRVDETGESAAVCSCGANDEPCKHLIWLSDQITKQILYDHDHGAALEMTESGFANEIGDPFHSIAEFHLDILAEALHCRIVDASSGSSSAPAFQRLDPLRIEESRELLSAVHEVPPEEFRPDIFTNPRSGMRPIKRGDLDCTVFRMLLDNNDFFHYFLSLSHANDPIRDPFRKLGQRVDLVLHDLDAYTSEKNSSSAVAEREKAQDEEDDEDGQDYAETLQDIPWAATHILGCVKLIRSLIFTRDRPLRTQEAISAARTLVHILEEVVSRNHDTIQAEQPRTDRNLYVRLIGDRDRTFVIGVLELIPMAASQFVDRLEAVLEQLGVHGAPQTYVEKLRSLVGRLRTSSSAPGAKRRGQGAEGGRDAKRMK